jgi:hypothetical protein
LSTALPSRSSREQQTHHIDLRAIHRVEIDRLGKPGENGDDTLKPGELAVRNGDALAEPG